MMFNKSSGKKNVRYIFKAPKVLVSPVAVQKMHLYTAKCDKEIGWFGTAVKTGDDIFIEDVYLFKQEVHGATNEITTEGLSQFAVEILNDPNIDGDEIYNNMKVWGHSHVNMGISPSAQDEKQFMFFQESGQEWFIRIICNKRGEICFDYVDFISGVRIDDLEWGVSYDLPDLDKEIEAEIKLKVSTLAPVYVSPKTYPGSYPAVVRKDIPDYNPSQRVSGYEQLKVIDLDNPWTGYNQAMIESTTSNIPDYLIEIIAEFESDPCLLAEIGCSDIVVGLEIIQDQVCASFNSATKVKLYNWCVENQLGLLSDCDYGIVEIEEGEDLGRGINTKTLEGIITHEDILDISNFKKESALDYISEITYCLYEDQLEEIYEWCLIQAETKKGEF